MAADVLFLEYPKCSTCQKAKKWLDAHGVAYADRHIVEDNPTAEELRLMEESVARCMEEGARGISAGLIYTPNKYQSTEELVALAKVAARYDGILDVHMRNEADHMAEALEEVIHIGRETGIRILVTHFKLRGRRNWGNSSARHISPDTKP